MLVQQFVLLKTVSASVLDSVRVSVPHKSAISATNSQLSAKASTTIHVLEMLDGTCHMMAWHASSTLSTLQVTAEAGTAVDWQRLSGLPCHHICSPE